jgi:hypothetical protein
MKYHDNQLLRSQDLLGPLRLFQVFCLIQEHNYSY